jgi:hypothetical protein
LGKIIDIFSFVGVNIVAFNYLVECLQANWKFSHVRSTRLDLRLKGVIMNMSQLSHIFSVIPNEDRCAKPPSFFQKDIAIISKIKLNIWQLNPSKMAILGFSPADQK